MQINNIIQSGIDVPGNENDLKKLQLQQLAELNGTFKPLDIIKWASLLEVLPVLLKTGSDFGDFRFFSVFRVLILTIRTKFTIFDTA